MESHQKLSNWLSTTANLAIIWLSNYLLFLITKESWSKKKYYFHCLLWLLWPLVWCFAQIGGGFSSHPRLEKKLEINYIINYYHAPFNWLSKTFPDSCQGCPSLNWHEKVHTSPICVTFFRTSVVPNKQRNFLLFFKGSKVVHQSNDGARHQNAENCSGSYWLSSIANGKC